MQFIIMQNLLIVFLLAIFGSCNAFSVSPVTVRQQPTIFHSSTQLYGWMDAFKNDETLGARENAGLKNGPNYNEQVTVNGKSVTGAVVGQKLTQVAMKARVKIPVNCQKGDCGTCLVNFNGRKVKGNVKIIYIYIYIYPTIFFVTVLHTPKHSF
jgi:ferredoxin